MNITQHVAGKTLEAAYTNGEELLLRTTDGQEYRIKWIENEPTLVGIDVRIMVQLPPIFGGVNL
jgi:hypothetical protein